MITLGLAVAAGSSIGCQRSGARDTTPREVTAQSETQADTSGDNDNMTADATQRPCGDPTIGTTINGETQTGDRNCDDTPRPSTAPLPPADPSDR
ncbi:MAG: hypothetical protein H0T46_29420 [Deltaproteobacteria bacterium]|nr:hypothetical protein [Deltaproteobacteria bacterium]